MRRRQFLHAAAATAALGLTACSGKRAGGSRSATDDTHPATVEGLDDLPKISWDMPTSWPANLEALFGSAQTFADEVAALTGGRFTITPRVGGDVVPALEVLPAVESGAFPIGHTTAYYYLGKGEFTVFGTALPFGLTTRQQNGWLYEGGGLELLQRLYVERFGVIQFPAGNTGAQMGGWFNRRIDTIEDLQGLRMRIPGLGGRVLAELGVSVQQIAGGELYQALETGALDAAEWVAPYDDLNLGLPAVAKYYYYPGWWDPGSSAEVQVNKRAYDELPELYRRAIEAAAVKTNLMMTARYDTLNAQALPAIADNPDVTILPFSDELLVAARDTAFQLYDDLAASNDDFAEVYASWNEYRRQVTTWFALAEASLLAFATRP